MKKYFLLFAILLVFLSACEPLTPVPPNLSAVIAEIEGDDVNVRASETSNFQPAQLNETLTVRSQLTTGVESRARIDLSSGTVVRVAPESLFTLVTNHETQQGLLTRIKVDVGRVWIVLNGGTLDVEIPSGLAGVRGSYMSAGFDSETGATRITCLEGQCSAENEAGTVQFTAGEAADLPADGGAPVKGEMTAEEFQMWADNVPESDEILPEEYRKTEETTTAPTATPTPILNTCTVTSTFLYVRTCPEASCETLGYAELDDVLSIAEKQDQEGWTAINFDGESGWVNSIYCE